MYAPPQLDSDAMRLLKTVDSASRERRDAIVRGGELMKTLGLEPGRFVALLHDLSEKNLISVSGALTPDRVDLATISLNPSNRGFIQTL